MANLKYSCGDEVMVKGTIVNYDRFEYLVRLGKYGTSIRFEKADLHPVPYARPEEPLGMGAIVYSENYLWVHVGDLWASPDLSGITSWNSLLDPIKVKSLGVNLDLL